MKLLQKKGVAALSFLKFSKHSNLVVVMSWHHNLVIAKTFHRPAPGSDKYPQCKVPYNLTSRKYSSINAK